MESLVFIIIFCGMKIYYNKYQALILLHAPYNVRLLKPETNIELILTSISYLVYHNMELILTPKHLALMVSSLMPRFLYSDEVQIGPETVMTTLYTAKKYAVPALEAHCVEFLTKHLRADNAFMLLTQVTV